MDEYQYLTAFVITLAIAEGAGVLLAVDAVMRPRSSQGAIAWTIALVTMPVLSIPL